MKQEQFKINIEIQKLYDKLESKNIDHKDFINVLAKYSDVHLGKGIMIPELTMKKGNKYDNMRIYKRISVSAK